VGLGNTIFDTEGKSAVWNGTRWVAVGISTVGNSSSYTHAYSNDGRTWTGLPKLLPRIDSLVWTGTKFVAIGARNSITSSDGINWVRYDNVFTIDNEVGLLATNGHRIVGIRLLKGGDVAVFSDDNGVTWDVLTKTYGGVNLVPDTGTKFTDIIWDGTKFIITTSLSGTTFISYDGYEWDLTSNVVGKLVDATNIVYDSLTDLYISRSNNANKTQISKDGLVWQDIDNTTLNSAVHRTTHGSIIITKQYVIIFLSNGKYLYSSNALTWDGTSTPNFTWTESTGTPSVSSAFSITSSQLTFAPLPSSILVGVGSGANTLSYSEDDGLTWVGLGQTVFNVEAACAIWNGTIWVAVGKHTDKTIVAYSSNGKVWTKVLPIRNFNNSLDIELLKSVVWVGSASKFVAVGGRDVITSRDGISWTSTTIQVSRSVSILASNGSSIIALPDQTTLKTLLYSNDIGNTWETVINFDTSEITPQGGGRFTDVLWDGTRYFALTGSHNRASAGDGSIWYSITADIGEWRLVEFSSGGSSDGNTNIGYGKLSDLYILRNSSSIDKRTQISKDGLVWQDIDNTTLNTALHSTTHGSIIITKQYVIIFLSNGKYLYSSNALMWDGTSIPNFTWTESTVTPSISSAFSN
jgi:hypothetical protein